MRAYSEYKDSGVEWLGEVPKHWILVKIGACFSERNEKVSDKDHPPLSVTKNGIVPQMENVAKTDAGDNRKKVCVNDFVINSRSDRKGSSGTAELNGSVSLISIVLRPRFFDPKYAHHLLRSYNFQEEFYRYGKGIVADLWSTRFAEMKNILVPLVPKDEQTAIANYLDRETGRIDKLITEKQNFIKLLKEKRQALISHVVTKGLDPNVKMKDSGVEWIGNVPEGWVLTKAKFVATIFIPQRNKPELNNTEGTAWITMDNMKNKAIKSASLFVSSSSLSAAGSKVLEAGAVIASCVGNFGIASINHINVIINQQLQAFIPHNIVSEFLRLHITGAKPYFESVGTASTITYVNQNGFENLSVVLPSVIEQQSIINHLNIELEKHDRLVNGVTVSIDLLSEQRTSLISAAVTGKIDVRDHA